MGWKTVGGVKGDLVKWDEPGMMVEGIFKGTWSGQFGPLAGMDTKDGRTITFPVPTALQGKLGMIDVGQLVRIMFLGMVKSGTGKDYKDFSCEV